MLQIMGETVPTLKTKKGSPGTASF